MDAVVRIGNLQLPPLCPARVHLQPWGWRGGDQAPPWANPTNPGIRHVLTNPDKF